MMISQICALQKAYGKTQAELETLVEGFSWAMAGYGIEEITYAMREYIKTNSDIPAPADIIKIIDRKRELDNYQYPTIETLIRYKKKGLPLTEMQKEQLRQYEEAQQKT